MLLRLGNLTYNKIIKKVFMAPMLQTKNGNLTNIFMKIKILDTLNIHQTISEFAVLKAREVQFFFLLMCFGFCKYNIIR